jgi:hypothetical protein
MKPERRPRSGTTPAWSSDSSPPFLRVWSSTRLKLEPRSLSNHSPILHEIERSSHIFCKNTRGGQAAARTLPRRSIMAPATRSTAATHEQEGDEHQQGKQAGNAPEVADKPHEAHKAPDKSSSGVDEQLDDDNAEESKHDGDPPAKGSDGDDHQQQQQQQGASRGSDDTAPTASSLPTASSDPSASGPSSSDTSSSAAASIWTRPRQVTRAEYSKWSALVTLARTRTRVVRKLRLNGTSMRSTAAPSSHPSLCAVFKSSAQTAKPHIPIQFPDSHREPNVPPAQSLLQRLDHSIAVVTSKFTPHTLASIMRLQIFIVQLTPPQTLHRPRASHLHSGFFAQLHTLRLRSQCIHQSQYTHKQHTKPRPGICVQKNAKHWDGRPQPAWP